MPPPWKREIPKLETIIFRFHVSFFLCKCDNGKTTGNEDVSPIKIVIFQPAMLVSCRLMMSPTQDGGFTARVHY